MDVGKYEETKGDISKLQYKQDNSYSSSLSNDRRSSMEPLPLIEEWDNLKQESNLKIVQGFFVKGIQQYFQDKLDKKVSLTIDKWKIVYVAETYPEMIISDGEWTMIWKIDNTTIKSTDLDLKNLNLKGKYIKLNDWNFTVKKESIVSDSQDFTKILVNIK